MTAIPNHRSKVAIDEIVANAPALIYVKDPDGRYLYVNKQFELSTGVSSQEALGQTDFDLFPAEAAAAYRKDDLLALEGTSAVHFEDLLFFPGSDRHFSTLKFAVLKDGQIVGVCGISVDISEPQPDPPARAERQSRADALFGRLLASLTPQEVRVLDLVATGLSDKEIAEKLSLSSDTVRHHISHLLKKLRKRRAQVIIEMLKRGRA